MKRVLGLFVAVFLIIGFMGFVYADDEGGRDSKIELEGTVSYLDVEGGCWTFESEGRVYEIIGLGDDFLKDGLRVKVEGTIDDLAVSVCQIGQVIQVSDVEPLEKESEDQEDEKEEEEENQEDDLNDSRGSDREGERNRNEDDENESQEREREEERNEYEEEKEYRYQDEEGNEYTYKYKVKVEDDGTLKREVEYKGHSFGSEVELEFFNVTEGNLTSVKFKAKLSNGNQEEVKVMPEVASEVALERLRAKNLTIELKEVPNDSENVNLAYEVRAEKEYRILGIFKTKSDVSVLIDTEDGEVLDENFPWWSFLASEVEEVTVNETAQ